MNAPSTSSSPAEPQGSAPFLRALFIGMLIATALVASWWLAFLLGWASPPSFGALAAPFTPVAVDLGRFVGYNLAHNLPFVLLAGGIYIAFEISFRRRIAAGESPAAVVTLFKSASLLLGLLTMAISLYGVLAASAEQGQDPRTLIGSLYFKFGLWVLNAVLMVGRYIQFESSANPAADE